MRELVPKLGRPQRHAVTLSAPGSARGYQPLSPMCLLLQPLPEGQTGLTSSHVNTALASLRPTLELPKHGNSGLPQVSCPCVAMCCFCSVPHCVCKHSFTRNKICGVLLAEQGMAEAGKARFQSKWALERLASGTPSRLGSYNKIWGCIVTICRDYCYRRGFIWLSRYQLPHFPFNHGVASNE